MSIGSDEAHTETLSDLDFELDSGGEEEEQQNQPASAQHQQDPDDPPQDQGPPRRGIRRHGRVFYPAGEHQPNRQMVLRDFLRLIAGNRVHLGEHVADNIELVNILKDLHVVRSDRVEKALLTCPRGTFVPEDYAQNAYLDAPIRVESMEFNISAPHMHATCLEALDVQKGERFLDAGSGSGIVAACGAFLVGKDGECMGFDIKEEILEFSKSCLQQLKQANSRFTLEAADVQFQLLNIFMPSPFRGYFDKIHVGGTCPEERLPCLIALLRPEGKMTVPVGQDLRLITRKADGRSSQRVLTQVRFSDLQVPSDAEIVLSAMEAEQEEHMHVPVPPSTLKEDSVLARSLSSECGTSASSPQGGKLPFSCLFGQKSKEAQDHVDLSSLSKPDCALCGNGWTLGAHRAVLRARCEHFRARFDSGMQDADDGELSVPEQFCQDAMASFLHYIYKDELPEKLSAQRVIEVLHVACYYGVPRLVILCERLLAEELKSQDGSDKETAAEYAPCLLKLADATGLKNLQNAVLHYIVRNYDRVCESESYATLAKHEVDMIARESFCMHKRYKQLLQDLSDNSCAHDLDMDNRNRRNQNS